LVALASVKRGRTRAQVPIEKFSEVTMIDVSVTLWQLLDSKLVLSVFHQFPVTVWLHPTRMPTAARAS
jgi:hypothetical protein